MCGSSVSYYVDRPYECCNWDSNQKNNAEKLHETNPQQGNYQAAPAKLLLS